MKFNQFGSWITWRGNLTLPLTPTCIRTKTKFHPKTSEFHLFPSISLSAPSVVYLFPSRTLYLLTLCLFHYSHLDLSQTLSVSPLFFLLQPDRLPSLLECHDWRRPIGPSQPVPSLLPMFGCLYLSCLWEFGRAANSTKSKSSWGHLQQ